MFGLASLCAGLLLSLEAVAQVSSRERSLKLSHQASHQLKQSPQVEAISSYQRGLKAFRQNLLDEAQTQWQQALKQAELDQDLPGQLKALEGLGLIAQRQEQLVMARQRFENAQQLAVQLGDRASQANTLGNLGNLAQAESNYLEALDAYSQALKIYLELSNPRRQGQILTNLGNVHTALGEYAVARKLYQQGLTLAEQHQDRSGQLRALNSLGLAAASQGRYSTAEPYYYQAWQIIHWEAAAPTVEATLLYNLGALEHAQQRFAQAQNYYEQALNLNPNNPSLVSSLESGMALLLMEQEQFEPAIDLLKTGLAKLADEQNPQRRALLLNNLGHVYFKAGQLPAAEQTLYEAIALQEQIRRGLITQGEQTDLNRVSLFDTQIHPYATLQEVLVTQGKFQAALLVAEQARAKALAELIRPSPSRPKTVDPEEVLETEAGKEAEAQMSLAQLQDLARSRQATLIEYAIIPDQDQIIQGKLQGEAKAIYIWVIQPDGQVRFREVDLKPLQEEGLTLAALLTNARCFDHRSICRQRLVNSTNFPSSTGPSRSFQFNSPPPTIPSGNSEGDSPVIAQQKRYRHLQRFHQLLIEPIAEWLPTDPTASVVIIPHNQLFSLPFSALQNSEGKFLIDRHVLTYAPSLKVFQLMEPVDVEKRWERPLLVGNPTMPLLHQATGPSRSLAPLPDSAVEVQAIGKALRVNPWVGAIATESAITAQLPQASWIHLATHSLLSYQVPDRSKQASKNSQTAQQASVSTARITSGWQAVPGAIALAPGQDAISEPGQDGLLTASEIMQLEIQAELVVLSACDTGRGDITSDGVIGLSRAWLGAGAKGVLASLWAVPDDATSMLMQQFYQHLHRGYSQGEALQQAMITTRQQFPNPEQWAAFTLMAAP